ncbi:MAG: CvpA family protein [Ignavibacteriaceae bacterium]|nr:CvpA family protein [Ignavibacteriaceae bacterium]
MTIIDILIIISLLAGFILGYKDGFVRKLIGLIGLAVAIYLTVLFAAPVGKFIEMTLDIEFYLSEIIGGAVIFIVIMIIISVVKRIVHPFDKVNNLLNQIMGGVIGLVQVSFFLSAVFIILKVFNIPDKETGKSAFVYPTVYSIIPRTIDYLQEYTPESRKIIKDFINEKDSI